MILVLVKENSTITIIIILLFYLNEIKMFSIIIFGLCTNANAEK